MMSHLGESRMRVALLSNGDANVERERGFGGEDCLKQWLLFNSSQARRSGDTVGTFVHVSRLLENAGYTKQPNVCVEVEATWINGREHYM